MDFLISAFLTIAAASTPLMIAAIGIVVVEKSGVLNLGIEGMMLTGAVAAFAMATTFHSFTLGVIAGMVAGALMALLFGVLVLHLLANQVATGLALTLFGIGLSALVGHGLVGIAFDTIPRGIPLLQDLPLVGRLLFGHDALVYVSIALVAAVWWFLNHTRAGLIVRAVGANHDAAHSIGYPVIRIRYMAVAFGGAMSGLAGAYLSLVYTPMWVEGMTAGRGWIALALVVFATWRPWRVMLGAYIFGGITIIQLNIQGFGVHVPSQFLSMLPYLATVVVLVLISRSHAFIKANAPACLGKAFHASS